MSKNTKRNNATPAGNNLPAVSKAVPMPKPNWPVVWSGLTDAIARHPVASSLIGAGAVVTVGGGIYLSHDVMEHDYDAEFNLLHLVHVKLNKRK